MSKGGLYWVEHEDLGYAPGICIGENDEELELQCEDGYTTSMLKSKAQPVHRNSLLGVPNLLELGDYNMPALLHNVRVRYLKDEFYSSIGLPILMSVNPYKPMPRLYDNATKLQYMKATIAPPTKNANGDAGVSPEDIPDRKLFISKPHLFATAQMTYSALIRNKQAQSIVISGESGAGKTEATKILLKYFSELDQGCNAELPSSSVGSNSIMRDCIERYILNSNPILESFGNAKTVRNDNSSRFGRFIQIYFDLIESHRIRCGRISHYLLEKCRLISLYESERNFHIFYQLSLGGMMNPYYNKKLIEWGILPEDMSPRSNGSAGDQMFAHLLEEFGNILGHDIDVWYMGNEIELFDEVVSCMMSIGFVQEDIDSILCIISSLMHLSKVKFVSIDSPDASYTDGMPLSYIEDIEPLRKVCQLLQIQNIPTIIPANIRDPVKAFSDILLFKIIRNVENTTGQQWIRTPRDPHHASEVRDSIIKEIYSKLFDWIIKQINKALTRDSGVGTGNMPSANASTSNWRNRKHASSSSSSAPTAVRRCYPAIGLLDIYGFEVFEDNSFEQLCINYANEKLQEHFNNNVLRVEQNEYRREGLKWNDISYSDNKCILKSLNQIFIILDDIIMNKKYPLPGSAQHNGSAGGYGVLLQGLQAIENIQLPKKMNNSFVVKHYAGNVQYNLKGFIQKNIDKLETQTSYFITKATTKSILKQLFECGGGGNSPALSDGFVDDLMYKRNSIKATVGVEFRNQLNLLIENLTATTPTYVRCIKPNPIKQPGVFNSKDVLRQLEYAGLLESIKIRNSGFGVRSTFHEFLDDYIIILKKQFSLYRKNKATLTIDQVKALAIQVLTDGCGNISKSWQIGRTKIFMKEEVQTALEQCRSFRRVQAATSIQAVGRMFHQRRRFKASLKSVIKIQALCRGFITRYLVTRHRAASTIQRYCMITRPVRKWFLGVKSKIRFIQTWWRFQIYKRSIKVSRETIHEVEKRVKPTPPTSFLPAVVSAAVPQPTSNKIPLESEEYFKPAPPHVSSMETNDDYRRVGRRQSMSHHPETRGAPRIRYESGSEYEDEQPVIIAARKKSLAKPSSEFNYEATIHLMFSELTSKLRKTEKENKKMRAEIAKMQNESASRIEEVAKLKSEKAALEMEMEERDRVAVAELEALVETNDSLQMKLRNIKNLNQGIEAVLTDMANYANERLRGIPDCDLVRDFSSYVKGCCSRGFDFLRSAMYQMSMEHDVLGDTYSPRMRNTPPPPPTYYAERNGMLGCRFSRIGEDELAPPPSSSSRARHFHRQRRNESMYDDTSSFGMEEAPRRPGAAPPPPPPPSQQRVGPFLRNTVSAYKPRNPYLQLSGKPLDGQWSTGAPTNDANSQYDTSERRMPYR